MKYRTMSHFGLLWKARTIEKHRQHYENEKHNSIIMSNADLPNKTLLQRWKHYSHDVQKHLSRTFSKWYPEGTTMSNFLVNFRAEMRFPHILLRSLFGFVGGLVLTYLCFVFLVFQLFLPLIHATVLSSLFGVLITLGLTFSNRMRCLIFLLIPQLFSRAGRYTLTCYALVLILTGPATNTLKNSEVLSESMACSQEQIKMSVREINLSLTKPYNSIKETIKLMMEQFKRITLKLRSAMLRVNRFILSIASLIQSNYSWLGSIAQSCNNQLGSPYQRCIDSLKESVDNCKACSEGAPWYYSAAAVARVACGVLKSYEKFCVASDFAGETFYATVKNKLKLFTKRISEALFVKIRTRHSYTFIGNTSSPSQVAAGIVTEIRNRADPILTWLSWSSGVTSLFLLLIIFRAKYYQHMYETRSRFDNRYITKEFRQLDLKRMREGRETVLPLNRRERAKYVTTTSFRLVTSEKIHLNRSAVFMMITSFKLLIHIVADYSLYWVLMTIRYHGKLQSPVQPSLPTTGAHITGTGFVSYLLQALFNTMNIPLLSASSPTSCLPKPHPPDFKRYSQIGTLIFLLWVFSLFEPYGLRLRHLIMGHYQPERAKTRAAWLYNHILRTRGSFMKFARRKLHREYKYHSDNILSFRHWLRSLVPFQWLRCLLRIELHEARCLLCNTIEDDEDVNSELIRCQDPSCPGTFCINCFSDIGQMCTICLSPKDYGDLSDISLEKGSSDEDGDNDEENGDSAPNKENALNERTDLDEKSNNNDTKYESDNKSENFENNRDIFYEISPLMQHQNDVTNEKQYNMMPVLNKQIFGATNEYTARTYERNTYIFYSFYKINIQDMNLVVTKNRQTSRLADTLRKQVTKSKKYFVSCKNNKKDGTRKVKKEDKKNQKPIKEKKGKTKENNSDNVSNNIEKNGVTNKPKKQQKKDNKLKVTSKNPCIDSLQAKCSKYWKNISVALTCTDIGDTKKNLRVIDEKKHKRKKKPKKCEDYSNKQNKSKNNEDTRHYRISTYLADRDWKKKEINEKVIDESSIVLTAKNFEENEIEVNHIRIPRLNLRFSSESLNSIIEGNEVDNSKNDVSKRKYLKFGALDRLIKRISLSSISLNSPKVVSKGLKIDNGPRQLTKVCNSEFNMSRSMKYFQSLGNDFVQQHHNLFPGSSICNDVFEFVHPVKDSSEASKSKNDSENSQVIKETIYNGDAPVEKKPKDAIVETNTIKEPINSKKTVEDLSKKCSNIKRQSSEKIFGFGFKSPLVMIKDLCTSLFTISVDKNDQHQKPNKTTANKEIAANPCMESCGCQISQNNIRGEQKDCCVQVEQRGKSDKKKSGGFFRASRDVQVNAVLPTCTCATQYYTSKRDVGTLKTQAAYRDEVSSDSETFEDSVFSESASTISDAQTNTTVCSLATLDYRKGEKKEERKEIRRKRVKVKVVTKANMSTLTDKPTFNDVSTATYDWWSPIVEKKECKKENAIEQNRAQLLVVKERRRVRNRGMVTDGRIVKFMSRAQIIPTNSDLTIEDILSPSRYLLESQKYYNELYASKLYSPHVFPVTRKHNKFEPRSPLSSHQSRRGRRTKRLEDCYIRKETPRNKRKEHSKPSDKTRQVRHK